MAFSYKKMIKKQKIKDKEKKKKFIEKCDKLLEELEKIHNKFSNIKNNEDQKQEEKSEDKEVVINNVNKDNKNTTATVNISTKTVINETKKVFNENNKKSKTSKCRIIPFEEVNNDNTDELKESDKNKKDEKVSKKPVSIPKSNIIIDQNKFLTIMKIFTTLNNDVDKAVEELKKNNVELNDDGDGTLMTEKGDVGISPDMKDGKTIVNATMSIKLKFIPHGNAQSRILNELGFSAEESYWENMGQDTKSCMIKCGDRLVNTTISIIGCKAIVMLLYNF